MRYQTGITATRLLNEAAPPVAFRDGLVITLLAASSTPRERGLVACFAISPERENLEDAMPHFMIRWQYTSTIGQALDGKPYDRTGAAKALR